MPAKGLQRPSGQQPGNAKNLNSTSPALRLRRPTCQRGIEIPNLRLLLGTAPSRAKTASFRRALLLSRPLLGTTPPWRAQRSIKMWFPSSACFTPTAKAVGTAVASRGGGGRRKGTAQESRRWTSWTNSWTQEKLQPTLSAVGGCGLGAFSLRGGPRAHLMPLPAKVCVMDSLGAGHGVTRRELARARGKEGSS